MKNYIGNPPISQEKSRSIWKGSIYAGSWFVGFAVSGWLLWLFTAFRVVFSMAAGEDGHIVWPWEGPFWAVFLVFLFLAWAPWIFWVAVRGWYKYAHNQEEVEFSRESLQKAWEIIDKNQDEVLGMIRGRITYDAGDNLGGDLNEIIEAQRAFQRKKRVES